MIIMINLQSSGWLIVIDSSPLHWCSEYYNLCQWQNTKYLYHVKCRKIQWWCHYLQVREQRCEQYRRPQCWKIRPRRRRHCSPAPVENDQVAWDSAERENDSDRLCVTDLSSGAVQPCGRGQVGDQLRDLHVLIYHYIYCPLDNLIWFDIWSYWGDFREDYDDFDQYHHRNPYGYI